MSFDLNNEKATSVLIWWIESSDGNIDYREKDEVEDVLTNMNYRMETYYQETLMHISGLSTDKMEQLIDNAIRWGDEHFDEQRKQKTVLLLQRIAKCDGNIDEDQQEKLDLIKQEFGLA